MQRLIDRFLGEDAYLRIARFLPFLKPFWKRGAIAGALMVVNTLLLSTLPLATMYVIDKVFIGKEYGWFHLICIGYVALNVFYGLSSFLHNLLLIKIRNRILFDIKIKLFEHLERQSLSFFHQVQSGYLTARSQNDVESLHGFMAETLLSYIMNILTFCIGLVLIFWLHPKLAIISLCILPFYFFLLLAFNKRLRALSYDAMEKQSRVQSEVQEKFAGIYTVFSFGGEKFEAIRCARKMRDNIRSQVKLDVLGIFAQASVTFVGSLGPLAIMYFGGLEIMQGKMSVGEFFAFTAYIKYLFEPAEGLTTLNLSIQRALAAMGRVFELLDARSEIKEIDSPVPIPDRPEEVAYSHVSFSYETSPAPVLQDISFRVRVGEVFALVGLSGAGKTTLVNLLPRFYDPTEGMISIGGIDVRKVSLRRLRQNIGIVPQDIFLFNGTIRENIGYGRRDATEAEITEAARAANAHEFILRLPQSYDTQVGERGVLLSGGEKQRIAIARAALRNPRILILDEATASLDSESEVLIQEALSELMRDKATLVIAHRLTTILNATTILVLNEGKIIEAGNHKELYAQNGFYRGLYDTQFRKKKDSAVLPD